MQYNLILFVVLQIETPPYIEITPPPPIHILSSERPQFHYASVPAG